MKKGEIQNTLYAGDTEGSVHVLRPEESWKYNSPFILEKTNFQFHRLTIIQILFVIKDSSVFTISFDQKIQGFEDLSGKQFFSLQNPHKALFTSIAWNNSFQELVVSDELGYVYFINAHTDKAVQEFKLYSGKIFRIEIIENLSQMIMVTEHSVEIVKIKRGIKKGNVLVGHTGPIIGLGSIDPYKITKRKIKEPAKLVSTSLDGTIIVWDPKDMNQLNCLDNGEDPEISCLNYLSYSNLFVTGHEQGMIKLWNLETNHSIVLDQKNAIMKHTDTICCIASGCITRQTANHEGIDEEITEYLFASGFDGMITFWEISEKKTNTQNTHSGSIINPQLRYSMYASKYQTSPQIGNEILTIIFHRPTNTIIAGGNKAELYFIKPFSYEHKAILKGHSDSITALAVDQSFLFSGSDDHSIRIWEADLCYALYTLENVHESSIRDLLIIEETGHLISCGFDGKINIWDYTKKKNIQTHEKKECFRCLTYIFSDKIIVAGTEENNIFCFDIDHLFKEAGINIDSPLIQRKKVKFEDLVNENYDENSKDDANKKKQLNQENSLNN